MTKTVQLIYIGWVMAVVVLVAINYCSIENNTAADATNRAYIHAELEGLRTQVNELMLDKAEGLLMGRKNTTKGLDADCECESLGVGSGPCSAQPVKDITPDEFETLFPGVYSHDNPSGHGPYPPAGWDHPAAGQGPGSDPDSWSEYNIVYDAVSYTHKGAAYAVKNEATGKYEIPEDSSLTQEELDGLEWGATLFNQSPKYLYIDPALMDDEVEDWTARTLTEVQKNETEEHGPN